MLLFRSATPYNIYGITPAAAPYPTTTPGIATASGPGVVDNVARWSPDHPLFWLAAFGAVTIGLIAASTAVRVGPIHGRVAVGQGA